MLKVRTRRIIKKSHQIRPQVTDSKAEKVQDYKKEDTEVNKTRLDLLKTGR